MSRENIEIVLDFVLAHSVKILDLTGGAPEMNPHFKYLVREARRNGIDVIDRCNLTILKQPGFEGMGEFLADQGVTITASLPCYTPQKVDRQRGKGVYEESIEVLKNLNSLGYGLDPNKQLNLVFNPEGLDLPPPQNSLEMAYKKSLGLEHGIIFNQLFTITNMPIKRFGGMLLAKGLYDNYMTILKDNYNKKNLDTVMCRNLLSVDYNGYAYDCDFNQMLGASFINRRKSRTHISELLNREIRGNPIHVGEHCFGCTAGQGSSCAGSLDS
jgi:radical SAM/Cys-rich protein